MKALTLLELIKMMGVDGDISIVINEAITELEDMRNRSCDNCKHNKEQDSFMIFCDATMCQDGSKMMWHSYTKDFCCNKWEKN